MASPLGFNVNDLRELPFAPGLLVVIGDPNAARAYQDRYPSCTVVYRHFDARWGVDDNIHTRASAGDYVQAIRAALGGDTRIVLSGGNEPTEDYPQLVKWTLDFIAEVRAANMHACVLNFSTGNPAAERWGTDFSPVLHTLAQSDDFLGMHEYALDYGQEVQPWYVGNHMHALTAADRLGIRRPNVLITECGYDRPPFKQVSRERGISDEVYARHMARLWNEAWAGSTRGAALFCYYRWDRNPDFDVSDMSAFKEELTRLLPSLLPPASGWPLPPVEAPTPEPEPPGDTVTLPRGELLALRATLAKAAADMDDALEAIDWVLADNI